MKIPCQLSKAEHISISLISPFTAEWFGEEALPGDAGVPQIPDKALKQCFDQWDGWNRRPACSQQRCFDCIGNMWSRTLSKEHFWVSSCECMAIQKWRPTCITSSAWMCVYFFQDKHLSDIGLKIIVASMQPIQTYVWTILAQFWVERGWANLVFKKNKGQVICEWGKTRDAIYFKVINGLPSILCCLNNLHIPTIKQILNQVIRSSHSQQRPDHQMPLKDYADQLPFGVFWEWLFHPDWLQKNSLRLTVIKW